MLMHTFRRLGGHQHLLPGGERRTDLAGTPGSPDSCLIRRMTLLLTVA